MKREVKVEYSFEKKAEVMDIQSEELKAYEEYFDKKILPEIKEVERRKTKAREKAYQIHVSVSLTEKV